jgi:hypothetical protein
MKKITIVLSDRVALWVSRRAAEENTSAAEFVRRVLENQMSAGDEYWRAYRKWKRLSPVKGTEAARRLSREQAHARR